MAPHSSTLAWKIPWTEEPGGLQSMGSLRVGHNWVTSLSLSCIGEGNGNPLQCSCLENPRDGGAWWAAIYGVTQSQTRLKRLSSSIYYTILFAGNALLSTLVLKIVLLFLQQCIKKVKWYRKVQKRMDAPFPFSGFLLEVTLPEKSVNEASLLLSCIILFTVPS